MSDLPTVPAIETAAELYEEQGLLLGDDIQNYLRHPHGVVIKRADLVVLARPVRLEDPETWLAREQQGDAWFVKLAVGGIRAALQEMPYLLPWCCWHRQFTEGPQGRLHVVETAKLKRRIP